MSRSRSPLGDRFPRWREPEATPVKGYPISTEAAQARPQPPPGDRDELLQHVGPVKSRLYETVREILDDLERAAPWGELYYPSTDDAGLLAMENALLETLDGIPDRIQAITAELQALASDEASRSMLGNAEFFFEGIHGSVAPDVARFRSKLKNLSATGELTSEDRDFVCEITADLKGKYSSSMMGAAASLIADGLCNGIEIEPVLFPEKAEEFERNELLVSTLNEVIENIADLLDDVPLAAMVERWERDQRVDLYALTPLYSFLGNLGKLMKESTRRALYSGDYHQIRKRERLLNVRINELTTLHNSTWAADDKTASPDGSSLYPRMIQLATELAAILDVNILRRILGEKTVKDLLFIVTIEKDRARDRGKDAGLSSMRRSIPENLHTLIPLLYDEDLQNFLGFLLGSVLKRASLALQRESRRPAIEAATPAQRDTGDPAEPEETLEMPEVASLEELTMAPPAPRVEAPGAPPAAGEVLAPLPDFSSLPDLDIPVLEAPALDALPETVGGGPGASPPVPKTRMLEALGNLQHLLEPLMDRANAHRKSFEMVLRLLNHGKSVPPAMLQSMHPFLYDVMNMLIPELNELDLRELSGSNASKLFDYCTLLCDRQLTPDQIREDVPLTMDRVLRLLDGLQAMTAQLIQDLAD